MLCCYTAGSTCRQKRVYVCVCVCIVLAWNHHHGHLYLYIFRDQKTVGVTQTGLCDELAAYIITPAYFAVEHQRLLTLPQG